MLNEFDALSLEGVGARPPITAAQTARQLLEFARARLPADQLAALEQWVGGASFEEIQADLGLTDAVEARKKVRAACETLRRHFGDGGGGV
jgi:hypothetical protein